MTSALLCVPNWKVLTRCQHFSRSIATQAQSALFLFDARHSAVRDSSVDTVSTRFAMTQQAERPAAKSGDTCAVKGCEFVRSVCSASVDTVSTLWRRRARRCTRLLLKAKSPRLRGLLAFMGHQKKGVGGRQ